MKNNNFAFIILRKNSERFEGIDTMLQVKNWSEESEFFGFQGDRKSNFYQSLIPGLLFKKSSHWLGNPEVQF